MPLRTDAPGLVRPKQHRADADVRVGRGERRPIVGEREFWKITTSAPSETARSIAGDRFLSMSDLRDLVCAAQILMGHTASYLHPA